ncbi:Alpha/Beta hydrolase protein [Parachaetomium inaequale]|uniref:Alpha/Beta hydrolase protein n=1 Tax=Parachaetomium inaequale TaxID=2588326 RepID=A0AAN6PPD9_9PEZI|nr:Alpha/Beta hydrolase protein [Parachaetomium inaequale]
MDSKDSFPADGRFGAVHIIEPSSQHTHTAIMLHGRGSNGPEFAEELAETAAPGQQPLTQRFPSWRWVFPSSQELWSTAFEEMLPAWFEAHSLTDTTAREDLQMGGIKESVAYMQSILDQEVARLGGDAEKVVIMGISQGGAIGMWTLLCQGILDRRFGAFVGASTWLPFAANIQRLLGRGDGQEAAKAASENSPSDSFVEDMLAARSQSASQHTSRPLLATPVFLGHGLDDAVVDVELGRQAHEALADVGFQESMDAFETTGSKPDRLHQSLSSAWASFLSAQHCSRELGAFRKSLDEHARQTSLSVASLQRDTATRHDLLATAVAEAKSKIEHHAAELEGTAALQTSLATLQQEIGQDREDASEKITELSEKLVAQQECLDGVRCATSHDIKTIQEQYRLTLEKVESLQGELRETRAEKLASELKLAALESQVTTMAQTRQGLSEDSVKLLDEILSRRDDLMRLLERQDQEIPSQSSAPPTAQPGIPLSQIPAPKRPAPSNDPSEDIRSLYLVFRDKYKTNPPKSDTAFIWQFIGSIENPAMSKHIQESLVAILPEHVKPTRDTRRKDARRKNPRKHVDISKGLTWRKFREALVKIPGPS